MADSLTTIISKVQTLLLDNGTLFTAATVTAAAREALKDFNLRAPIHAGTLIDVINGQKEYELTLADSRAINILDVLQKAATGEDDIPLTFDYYTEDARIWFRLRATLTTGAIIARYTIPHTVSGLDSAAESTLPALYDQILVDGTCYHSCIIRAASRIESINLQSQVSLTYKNIAPQFLKQFETGLAYAARQYMPVGKPGTRAWDDAWHDRDR